MQNILASNTMEALYEKYDRHNDLQILDSYIEYDKKTDDLKYMTYLLRKREDNGTLGDESEWKEYIKVVKLCKVFNVPRELREKKALMVSQDEFLSAIWSNQIRFITVYCNIPDNTKKVKGFYYLYGIQVIEPLEEESDIYSRFNTDEEKKVLLANYVRKKADQQYAAVIKALRGTFRQAQFLPLTRRETDAVRDVIENAKYMQAIRGLPKTHISAASGVTTSLEGVTTTPEGIEQNEEFIRTLLHDTYANIVMAFPISHSDILAWSSRVAREFAQYESQYSGNVTHNAGISVPMIFAGNLGNAAGTTQGVTDTTGESLGVSQGTSDNLTRSLGDSQTQSHNMGYSQGMSQGSADSVSQANSATNATGYSDSHSLANSNGVSSSESYGTTHGTTDTQGVSRSHGVGRSETYAEGRSQGQSVSRSYGESWTNGYTHGITNGVTNGTTNGTTHGFSNSFGTTTGDTYGLTQGHTSGHTTGLTNGLTTGTTTGHTTGLTQGHTTGLTQGTSMTIGHTTGNTIGTTTGHTTGLTTGQTISDGTSMSDSTSHSITNGTTHGTSTSRSNSMSQGQSWNAGHTTGTNWTQSTSHGNTISDGYSTSYSHGRSHTEGNTSGNSFGFSNNHNDGSGRTSSASSSWNVGANAEIFSGSLSGSHGEGTTHGNSTNHSDGYGDNYGWTNSHSSSDGTTESWGQGNSHTESSSDTTSRGHGGSNGYSYSRGATQSYSQGISNGTTDSTSQSYGTSQGHTSGTSHTVGRSTSNSSSDSVSQSHSQSSSDSLSRGTTTSTSNSNSVSNSSSDSMSTSRSTSRSTSTSNSLSDSLSKSHSQSLSHSNSQGTTNSNSLSRSLSNSHSASQSWSQSHGTTQGLSIGNTVGYTQSHGIGRTVSDSVGETHSRGVSNSSSHSLSNGLTRSQSIGHSVGTTQSTGMGHSAGTGKTTNTGLSESLSDGRGVSRGQTSGTSRGAGNTTTNTTGMTNSRGLSNAASSTMSMGQGLTMSFGPTIGVSRSYQTFDEEKKLLISLLEQQNLRASLATRMGAFFVDSYILTQDETTKVAAAIAARSSFGGDNEMSTIQVVDAGDLAPHLLKHASVWVPCTMKEDTVAIADGYFWSTIMLTSELAALTHLPRVETGGISTVATNIPPFSVFANKNGEIYFGRQINYEDGEPNFDFYFSKSEFMHTLICGGSGCGKTTSAVRIAKEVIMKYKDMKVLALDWKNSWRVLKKFATNVKEEFEFYGLDDTSIRPIKINLYVPPKYIGFRQWLNRVNESMCLGFGFGTKMYSVLDSAAMTLFVLNGIMKVKNDGSVEEVPRAIVGDAIYNVTISDVAKVVRCMKEGKCPGQQGGGGKGGSFGQQGGHGKDNPPRFINDWESDFILKLNKLDPVAQDYVKKKFSSTGMGMKDAFDSILQKLADFETGTLCNMYCATNPDECMTMESFIDGKRITVLEGGDLGEAAKKFIIELISWAVFLYSKAKKMYEKKVEKRFFIMEEAHRIIENPETGNAPPLGVTEDVFQIIFNEGREYGLYAMPIVQSPSLLPPTIITNCSILIVHRLGNKDDLDMMTSELCRNARLDNRDVPIWIAKQPIGQAIVRINNTIAHQYAEPCLVQVARCETDPPSNEEMVFDLDLPLPEYMKQAAMNDPYLPRDKIDEMLKKIYEEYEAEKKAREDQQAG